MMAAVTGGEERPVGVEVRTVRESRGRRVGTEGGIEQVEVIQVIRRRRAWHESGPWGGGSWDIGERGEAVKEFEEEEEGEDC